MYKKQFLSWLIPMTVLAIWTVVSYLGSVPEYLLPPPAEIVKTGYIYLFGNAEQGPFAGRFLNDTWVSLLRVFLGFLLAAILGLPLGILSGRVKSIQQLLGTSINAVRAVPGISWLPLALVWFGIGFRTTIFLVALAAFFPIYLNAASGARQVNPIWLQSGAMMGVDRLRGTFLILIPGAMPQIVTGLRLGLGISWAYLVLGELTGVPDGIGAVIMDARMVGRIDMIMVGIILIAIIGRISDKLLISCLRIFSKSARRMT